MAIADASVSITKSLEKSGRVRTDTDVILLFNSVKAESAAALHVNVIERRKSVRGAASKV